MITDDDIQKLTKTFKTRKEADEDLKKLEEKFVTKVDLKLEIKFLEERLEEKFVTNERFDQALGKLDYIIGELKEVREEQAAHSLRHDDIGARFKTVIPCLTRNLYRS